MLFRSVRVTVQDGAEAPEACVGPLGAVGLGLALQRTDVVGGVIRLPPPQCREPQLLRLERGRDGDRERDRQRERETEREGNRQTVTERDIEVNIQVKVNVLRKPRHTHTHTKRIKLPRKHQREC